MLRKPDISEWAREFPPFTNSSAGHDDRRWYQFARIVQDCHRHDDARWLQSAFDRLEESLTSGNPQLREWVMGFLQALQDVTAWSERDGERLLRFMGEQTRRVWSTLDAIRSDLAECSTLEAEVLMWRVVHPTRQAPLRS